MGEEYGQIVCLKCFPLSHDSQVTVLHLEICEQQMLIAALHVGRGNRVEKAQPFCFLAKGMA